METLPGAGRRRGIEGIKSAVNNVQGEKEDVGGRVLRRRLFGEARMLSNDQKDMFLPGFCETAWPDSRLSEEGHRPVAAYAVCACVHWETGSQCHSAGYQCVWRRNHCHRWNLQLERRGGKCVHVGGDRPLPTSHIACLFLSTRDIHGMDTWRQRNWTR